MNKTTKIIGNYIKQASKLGDKMNYNLSAYRVGLNITKTIGLNTKIRL